MEAKKVIGIGFHKTGTTSLAAALETLGYKVIGFRSELAESLMCGQKSETFLLADQFDAMQDNPWPVLYRELDQRYPNCKFILTWRNEQKWITSIVNHFGGHHSLMREWIYGEGDPLGNEALYLDRYRKHNQEVRHYFKDRQNDLLIINWEEVNDWKPICNFLNKRIPRKPLPHVNKGNYWLSFENHKRWNQLKRKIKNFL